MTRSLVALALFAATAVFVAGCDKKSTQTEFKGKHGHDHSDHERKDAQIEDIKLPDGEYHAGLQAHLSNEPGKNELDLFFETHENKPHPIPKTYKLTARVTREGDNNAYQITFEPADPKERPGDPADKCSRFSAETPWMKPDDKLTVVLTVEVDKQIFRCTFPKEGAFVPKDKQHKHE
jgi:hypothetical protein